MIKPIIILLSITCIILLLTVESSMAAPTTDDLVSAKLILVHGDGSGKVTCPDGTQGQANVAFIILSVKGLVQGNWTLDDYDEQTNQGTFFTEGKIYGGNVSLNQFRVIGNSDNVEEQIKLCNPYLFTPISITGICGQDVAITVQLHSIKMLKIADVFKGDVTCK